MVGSILWLKSGLFISSLQKYVISEFLTAEYTDRDDL